MEQQPTATDIFLANLLNDPTLVPDNLKVLVAELEKFRPIMENIEQSLAQGRETMKVLNENRLKTIGSIDTLISMIMTQAPKELVEQYSKQLIEKKE